MLPRLSALAMFVALIPWVAIAECIMRAATSVFENGNIIKKISFPSELLAVNLVGYNIVNIAAGFGVFIAALVITLGVWPSPAFLAFLPVVMLLQAVFMLGLSYLVSTTTVFVRDVIHLIPIAMQVWMFLSPIFYFGLPPGARAIRVDARDQPGLPPARALPGDPDLHAGVARALPVGLPRDLRGDRVRGRLRGLPALRPLQGRLRGRALRHDGDIPQ